MFDDIYDGPVDGDDLIGDVVKDFPEVIPYLASVGMHCIGCSISASESVYDACTAHHVNPVRTVYEMNRIIRGEE